MVISTVAVSPVPSVQRVDQGRLALELLQSAADTRGARDRLIERICVSIFENCGHSERAVKLANIQGCGWITAYWEITRELIMNSILIAL